MSQKPKPLAFCLWLGLRAMFRPAYWWLALWPVLVSVLGIGLLLWWALPLLMDAMAQTIQSWQALMPSGDGSPGLSESQSDEQQFLGLPAWLVSFLVVFLKLLASPGTMSLLAWIFGLLAALPLSWLFVLVVSGLVVTPTIRADLLREDYPALKGRAGGAWAGEIVQTLWVMFRLAAGLLLLLPLWFVAPWLAAIVFVALMAWSTASVFLIDCLSGISSAGERQALMQSERSGLMVLGALVATMGSLPLMWLVAPIFASVVFGHFSLSRLDRRLAGDVLSDVYDIRDERAKHD